MIALAPATEDEPVEAVPLPAPEPPKADRVASAAPTMPHTGSQLALSIFMGLLCLATALAMRLARRRG
jgi:LPXTG-motif cell wall-anchored protein